MVQKIEHAIETFEPDRIESIGRIELVVSVVKKRRKALTRAEATNQENVRDRRAAVENTEQMAAQKSDESVPVPQSAGQAESSYGEQQVQKSESGHGQQPAVPTDLQEWDHGEDVEQLWEAQT